MSDTKSLPADDTPQLESGDDLASQALSEAQQNQTTSSTDDEAEQSDQYAETLSALEGLIERSATKLEEIKQELKERREMLKNYYENDAELADAEEQAKNYSQQIKERKTHLQGQPQAVDLKTRIQELGERSKELEETLSNHLVRHYQMTNSTSFDTSDGDQWEYIVKARVKSRPKH